MNRLFLRLKTWLWMKNYLPENRFLQWAYEELQRDGFIETEIGRGTYILARNKDFYKEQKQKEIEEHLQSAIAIAKENAIPLEKIVEVLKILYLEE